MVPPLGPTTGRTPVILTLDYIPSCKDALVRWINESVETIMFPQCDYENSTLISIFSLLVFWSLSYLLCSLLSSLSNTLIFSLSLTLLVKLHLILSTHLLYNQAKIMPPWMFLWMVNNGFQLELCILITVCINFIIFTPFFLIIHNFLKHRIINNWQFSYAFLEQCYLQCFFSGAIHNLLLSHKWL